MVYCTPCTAFLRVTWRNFSEYRMFWHELLQRHHGQSVLPTSAEISTGCQSINQRVIYKLFVLTYKALHTGQPCYLADLFDLYRPSRALQSTNSHLLAVPSCRRSSFASRAFCVSSPNNWNSLPLKSAHLTVLLLSSPVLNLTFLLLSVTHTPAPQIRPSTIGAI